MKKLLKSKAAVPVCLFLSFFIWTALVLSLDVQSIAPNGTGVGLATINKAFHNLTGTNFLLYTITDFGGIVPIVFAFGFAILGLCQLIKRKSLMKVDHSILLLGVFYIVVIICYVFFEYVVINYRPVLINGYSEASYPSSTTLLVLCVMPTAMMQFSRRIKNKALLYSVNLAISLFTVFMLVGRILSGVHWISDIIGALLFSLGAITAYRNITLFTNS